MIKHYYANVNIENILQLVIGSFKLVFLVASLMGGHLSAKNFSYLNIVLISYDDCFLIVKFTMMVF